MTFDLVDGNLQFNRELAITFLIERDGLLCQFPGCNIGPFNEDSNHKHALSIDHIFPQARARRDGWSFEQIWDLDNLQLMHRSCNARKSDLVYDENGNLPIYNNTRAAKGPRPEWCELCDSGRLLYPEEKCPECGSGPQPSTWPATLQRKPKECDHFRFHCFMCVVGHVPRVPAFEGVFFDSEVHRKH